MAFSGLGSMKRSWSGNQQDLGGVSTMRQERDMPAKALQEVRVNVPAGSRPSAAIDLGTPSPEKKVSSVDNRMSFSSKDSEGASSMDSDLQRKRKLPECFTPSASHASRFGFKTAAQMKSEGAKTAFYSSSGGIGRTNSSTNPLIAPKPSVSKIFLSKEQRTVHDHIVNLGRNVFFTGSAGTGKSVALRETIKGLRMKYASKQDAVAVTASTGIAACNIGGVTLHSFAGCGLGAEPAEVLVGKIKKNRKSSSRWMRTIVLVIDEISMVDPDFLDKLDKIGQIVRRSPKPFGGIQVVMTGDFFQLPPVNKSNTATRYAFDAQCWSTVVQESINLTQVFRQKDSEFVNMLNELRFGTLSPKSVKIFRSLTGQSQLEKQSKMPATALFPMRQEVEKANAEQLMKITQPSRTFDAIDGGTLTGEMRQKALDNFMAPPKLRLKAGCQVMLIKNKDEQLVNGSIGTVLTFMTVAEFKRSQYADFDWESVQPDKMKEEEIMTKLNEQYWNTVNGSSGAKRNSRGEIDEKRAAQLIEYEEIIKKEEKKEKLARSRSASPEKEVVGKAYPVVRFFTGNHRFRTELMEPDTWKNEQPNGETMVSRTQVPLILAWAMSIHKSQGQTIPIVKIDLGRVFEKGQAYVALSRAVSKEGLQVLNFNPARVMADPRVIKWYKALPTVQ